MAYATAADVRTALPAPLLAQLTDETGQAVQDGRIDAECARQSAIVDSYLLRLRTPVVGPPEVLSALRAHTVVLVLAALLQGRLIEESYHSFRKNLEASVRWLEKIRDGESDLPGAELSVSLTASPGRLRAASDAPVFGTGVIL